MAQTMTAEPAAPQRRFNWQFTDIFVALGIVLLVVGAWGMWTRLTQGLAPTELNSYVPWGLWVGFYDYLVWLEVGSLLVFTTLVYLVGYKPLAKLKPTIYFTGFVVLLMALIIVLLDLGHPARFLNVYLYPDFGSMITWMVWLHTLYLIILAVKLVLVINKKPANEAANDRILRILAYVSLPMGLALIIVSGSIFGVVTARPLWNTSSLPLMFLISSLAAGSGLIALLAVLFWPDKQSVEYRQVIGRLARMTAWLLLAGAFAAAVIGFTFLYQGSPARADAVMLILTGPFWWSFWIVHLLLGVGVPLLILFAQPEKPAWVGVAAFLSVITFVAVTLNIVIPVLATPELENLALSYVDPKMNYNYVPNLAEWLLIAFIFGLGSLAYGLGMRWLPVKPAK
jgi:molybdopterin-containing oxidoreductase family membrane subunit